MGAVIFHVDLVSKGSFIILSDAKAGTGDGFDGGARTQWGTGWLYVQVGGGDIRGAYSNIMLWRMGGGGHFVNTREVFRNYYILPLICAPDWKIFCTTTFSACSHLPSWTSLKSSLLLWKSVRLTLIRSTSPWFSDVSRVSRMRKSWWIGLTIQVTKLPRKLSDVCWRSTASTSRVFTKPRDMASKWFVG